MEKSVLLTKEKSIAKIILNRPQSLNAINDLMVTELTNALLDVTKDENVKVVVIKGMGKGFCVGGDFNYIQSLKTQVEAREFIKKVGNVVKHIRTMEKPVVCLVNGIAAGAGYNLVLACDIVFCATSARFSHTLSHDRYNPNFEGEYPLSKSAEAFNARYVKLSAELIDSEMALSLGIVNKVVEDEILNQYADKYINQLVYNTSMLNSLNRKENETIVE